MMSLLGYARGPLATGEGGSHRTLPELRSAQVDSVLPADGRRPARLPDDATKRQNWQSGLFTRFKNFSRGDAETRRHGASWHHTGPGQSDETLANNDAGTHFRCSRMETDQ